MNEIIIFFVFILQDAIPESISFQLTPWRVSAEWIFHSEDNNEWMSEIDYEVDENGEKLKHRHHLTVDDLKTEEYAESTKTIVCKKQKQCPPQLLASKRRLKLESGGSTVVVKQNVLPTAAYPDCGEIVTIKGLKRHREEIHNPKQLNCNFEIPETGEICPFTTTRKRTLLDHQRRIHIEPVAKGRPKKNISRRRKRSPFRARVFDERHKTTIEAIQMNSHLKSVLMTNCEEMKKVGIKLEETQVENDKNEQRLRALEDSTKEKDNEMRKVKTRVIIIESKQKDTDLPDVNDIPAILDYLNLTESSTKKDIRKTINLRLMETSPESLLSKEIYNSSKMEKEKQEELTMFYNEASIVLMKWKKTTIK